MEVPTHASIRALGFVDDEVREALLARARVLVMPSPFESLSMVLLEAWNHGAAGAGERALPRARAARPSARTAGLYFRSVAEFEAALDYLLDHDDTRRRLGAQGLAYVDREYRWPTVMAKIEATLEADVVVRDNISAMRRLDAGDGCLRAARRLRRTGAAAVQAGASTRSC